MEKQWWNDTSLGDHIEVRVCNYHFIEWEKHLPRGKATVRVEWDHFDYDELLSDAVIGEAEWIQDARRERPLKKAFDKRYEAKGLYDRDLGFDGTIIVLWGSRVQLEQFLHEWIANIKTDNRFGQGGDDSFYDDDPDELLAVYQLAKALGEEEAYTNLYNWAMAETNYGEDAGDNPIEEMTWEILNKLQEEEE